MTGSADAVAKALDTMNKKLLSKGQKPEFLAFELPFIEGSLRAAYLKSLSLYLEESVRFLQKNNERRIQELVAALTPTPALSKRTIRLELANAEMRRHVLGSADWLTAGDIATLTGSSSSNPNAQTSKWKRDKKIFAIVVDGVDKFPAYALDENQNYRPRPAMKEVISAFGPKRAGWSLAFWFASANSYLEGKQPQEVISVDPGLVIEAAKDKAEGIQHG